MINWGLYYESRLFIYCSINPHNPLILCCSESSSNLLLKNWWCFWQRLIWTPWPTASPSKHQRLLWYDLICYSKRTKFLPVLNDILKDRAAVVCGGQPRHRYTSAWSVYWLQPHGSSWSIYDNHIVLQIIVSQELLVDLLLLRW